MNQFCDFFFNFSCRLLSSPKYERVIKSLICPVDRYRRQASACQLYCNITCYSYLTARVKSVDLPSNNWATISKWNYNDFWANWCLDLDPNTKRPVHWAALSSTYDECQIDDNCLPMKAVFKSAASRIHRLAMSWRLTRASSFSPYLCRRYRFRTKKNLNLKF